MLFRLTALKTFCKLIKIKARTYFGMEQRCGISPGLLEREDVKHERVSLCMVFRPSRWATSGFPWVGCLRSSEAMKDEDCIPSQVATR